MNNIVIVENDEKYCFENIKEIVKQFPCTYFTQHSFFYT